MSEQYKGIIVLESIEDKEVINKLNILNIKVTNEPEPDERWHLYTVSVSAEEIINLSKIIKPKWYMHFWKAKEVIAVFKDKTFSSIHNKKKTWKPVIDYGLSIGIPKEQLDFPID